jgi:hypothetical protein
MPRHWWLGVRVTAVFAAIVRIFELFCGSVPTYIYARWRASMAVIYFLILQSALI